MSNDDFDWLDDDYGLDQESDRVIENDETLAPSVHRLPWDQVGKLPPQIAENYEDVYISYTEQTHYGIKEDSLVEIPRSEWMEPETYRSWLSNGGGEL